MPKKLHIVRFNEVTSPITSAVTKFGGRPVWVGMPQWPISPVLGTPMRFICQIRLEPTVFGGTGERLAYVFCTEGMDQDGRYVCGGAVGDLESAVIVQPGGITHPNTQPLLEGPSLYKMVAQAGKDRLTEQPVEYEVELEKGDDPEFVTEGKRHGWDTLPPGPGWSEERKKQYEQAVRGNKIGGTPALISNEELPTGGPWRLLLQLEGTPFEINFGDAGAGFVWVDHNLQQGLYFSQSC